MHEAPLPDAFYEPTGERTYLATTATISPWRDDLQHGGPPCALAAHALERAFPRPGMRIARLVVDFLGAIPRAEMSVRSEIVRPGKRVELSRTVLACEGRDVVSAAVWRLATRSDVPVPAAAAAASAAPPPAMPPPHAYRSFAASEWPYGRAIEWRFVRGGFGAAGPADVWTRPKLPLVLGRTLSPVERVALVADSANGVSAELDFAAYLFVPPTIAITLGRYPAGEWTFLGAQTWLLGDGIGYTTCRLADEAGTFGTASQPLLLEPRE